MPKKKKVKKVKKVKKNKSVKKTEAKNKLKTNTKNLDRKSNVPGAEEKPEIYRAFIEPLEQEMAENSRNSLSTD